MNALSGVATLETAATSRVVQLSDTHLMREFGGQLVGIDTDRSLAAVCRLVAAQGPVDALLLTGDLAGDEAEEAYGRLDEALAPLGVPSFWLPGNHDAVWSDDHPLRSHFKRTVQLPHWDILMLNTQHPGVVAGHLADPEIQALEQAVDHAQKGGLPGPGTADDADHLAGRDLKRDVVDRLQVSEPLRQIFQREHRLSCLVLGAHPRLARARDR